MAHSWRTLCTRFATVFPHFATHRPRFCRVWAVFLLFLAVVSGLCTPFLPFGEGFLPADSTQTLPEGAKYVALTFDDGPKAATTAPLLDGLAQRGVKATFFLIGEQIPGNEDLIRRMAAEGHQIGLHTLHHVKLQGRNRADLDEELGREQRALADLLGQEAFYLRPPYGLWDEGLRRYAQGPIILWSVDPEDWNQPDAARVTQHILTHVKDGDIILLHDIYPESVEAALAAVDALREEGYWFLTVEELLTVRGITPTAGEVYRRAG